MARWWETNDYDDGEQPGKQDTPAGWKGPFGPPKPRGACAVVLLLVWPALPLAWWCGNCGDQNFPWRSSCKSCGRGRTS
jgi:hypothetical protein